MNLKQKFQDLNKNLTLSAVPPPVVVASNSSSPYSNKIKDNKNDDALKSELVLKLIQSRHKKLDYERLSSEFLMIISAMKSSSSPLISLILFLSKLSRYSVNSSSDASLPQIKSTLIFLIVC